jgi:hypothetical protein
MNSRTRLAVASVAAVLSAGTALVVGTPASAAPTVAAAPGEFCATPLGVSSDADGDVHHRFRLPTGLVEDQIVPAADFNPATAPSGRLRKFGLPARPVATAADRPEWDRAAVGVKHRRTPKPSCVKQGVRATQYSLNYSGYRATAASGKAYSGAHSSYTAPSYYLSTCSRESMTQWVGVANDTLLIQSGVYVTQYTGALEGGGFFEVVGGSWDTGSLVSVRGTVPYIQGHRYYFSVQYADRYDWAVIVENLDNGDTYSGFIHNPGAGGTQYIQPHAYFVSERLSYGSALTQYMNHSDVRFRAAMVHIDGESDARLSIQRPEDVVMISPGLGNLRLSNSDQLNVTESSFTEHWARCGVVE